MQGARKAMSRSIITLDTVMMLEFSVHAMTATNLGFISSLTVPLKPAKGYCSSTPTGAENALGL